MAHRVGRTRAFAWVAAAALACGASRADVLLTTDGRAVTGTVRIDAGGLRVDGGRPVAMGEVIAVTFAHPVRAGGQWCVLAEGTTLVGRIAAIDEHGVRVTTAAAGTLSVPMDRVARVCFGPVPGELLARVPTGGAGGLLLRDGDFFEGTLRGFDGHTVEMTSPLLGTGSFDAADRAAALVVRPAARPAAAWVVRTTDGSALATETLSVAANGVRVDVAGVGPVTVPSDRLVDVRAGGDRITSLADLRPTAGVASADGTGAGLAARLVGSGAERTVSVASGSAATYRLDGRYAAFACRVGTAAGVVPMVGVRWTVRADGRTVASGGPRTSVEDPAVVCVPVAGAAELTVSAESATAGVPLVLGDPVLARRTGAATRSGVKTSGKAVE